MLKDLKWEEAQRIETEWKKILLRAADILDEKGWCQGDMVDERGQHCALGAIDAASFELQTQMVDAEYAETALLDYLAYDVAEWNDEAGRRKEEVTTAMRAAAKV